MKRCAAGPIDDLAAAVDHDDCFGTRGAHGPNKPEAETPAPKRPRQQSPLADTGGKLLALETRKSTIEWIAAATGFQRERFALG